MKSKSNNLKLQIHVIPEVSLDILMLIISLSFALGTFILYTEYNLKLIKSDSNLTKLASFLEVVIGNKCLLYDKTDSKGILDYQKLSTGNLCMSLEYGLNFYIEGKKEFSFLKDCSREKEVVRVPILVAKNDKIVEGYVEAC